MSLVSGIGSTYPPAAIAADIIFRRSNYTIVEHSFPYKTGSCFPFRRNCANSVRFVLCFPKSVSKGIDRKTVERAKVIGANSHLNEGECAPYSSSQGSRLRPPCFSALHAGGSSGWCRERTCSAKRWRGTGNRPCASWAGRSRSSSACNTLNNRKGT